MVQYQDEAEISIQFNLYSGEATDSYNILFDGNVVDSGSVHGSKTTAVFEYSEGGKYDLQVQTCNSAGCSISKTHDLIIADTDGSHLDPLPMDIDPNNKSYTTNKDTVVGTYFVEWGIYGRDYTVDNIPADNLTHILYGFIPICGPNESLKPLGDSHKALTDACVGSEDYEVVVHDPWAAYQKNFEHAGQDYNSPIKGNYGMMMALKQRNPDLKILPSIGGWTLSDPFADFTDKNNRDTFVASVKEFLNTWKFYDGVDIDWEFPGGGGANPDLGDPDKDGPTYIALMRELRVMLDDLERENNRDYELTSAIGVGYDKIEDVDYGEAVQYMDYIFAMSYDFYGAWDNVLGHQTAISCGTYMAEGQCEGIGAEFEGPAYTLENGINLLLAQGLPANQLVVGVAAYGRGWSGVMPSSLTDSSDPFTGVGNGKLQGTPAIGVWEPGTIDYKGIKTNMLGEDGTGINGFEYGYDAEANAPWVWNRSTGELITYDDQRSVIAKGDYVRKLDLEGLFSWEIDADNGDILNAMHEGLDGYVAELPNPGEGTEDPSEGTEEPGTGTEDPSEGTEDPSEGTEEPAPTNRTRADAGEDQTMQFVVGTTAFLDGTGSTVSKKGEELTYQWAKGTTKGMKKNAVKLRNVTRATAKIILDDDASLADNGTMVFKLTVTDQAGVSRTDRVTYTFNNENSELPEEIEEAEETPEENTEYPVWAEGTTYALGDVVQSRTSNNLFSSTQPSWCTQATWEPEGSNSSSAWTPFVEIQQVNPEIPFWELAGGYSAGDKVQSNFSSEIYTCDVAGWCGQRQPESGNGWEDAWVK